MLESAPVSGPRGEDDDREAHASLPPPSAAETSTSEEQSNEVLVALPALGRALWFLLGAVTGAALAVLAVLQPWRHPHEAPLPYEFFPFATNDGVCQEWVALAEQSGPRSQAEALRRTVAARLQPASGLRPENLRVVHAFEPGERFVLAVDAQRGVGDERRAQEVASQVVQLLPEGPRFRGRLYDVRELYDSAQVLCMPRQGVAAAR